MNMIDIYQSFEPKNNTKAKHIMSPTTNLMEKDIPNSKSQMEGKRV